PLRQTDLPACRRASRWLQQARPGRGAGAPQPAWRSARSRRVRVGRHRDGRRALPNTGQGPDLRHHRDQDQLLQADHGGAPYLRDRDGESRQDRRQPRIARLRGGVAGGPGERQLRNLYSEQGIELTALRASMLAYALSFARSRDAYSWA